MSAPQEVHVETDLFLRSLGLGRPTGEAAGALARAVEPTHLRRGTVLYERGAAATWVDYIVSGTIELRAPGARPWRFGPRDTIGVHDLFLKRPRRRDAVAESDVHLLRIRCDEYLEILEDSHEFTRLLISTVGASLLTMTVGIGAGVVAGPPCSLLDRVTLLARCPPFSRARVQSLVDLAGVLVETSVRSGAIVSSPPDGDPRIMVIARGTAELIAGGGDPSVRYGEATLLGGYASFREPAQRPRARFIEDGLLLHVDDEDLYAVVDDHFDLALSILAGIATEREATREG